MEPNKHEPADKDHNTEPERLVLLAESAAELLRGQNPEVFLDFIFGRLAALIGVEAYDHHLALPNNAGLSLTGAFGFNADELAQMLRVPPKEGICWQAADERKPIVRNDLQETGDERAQLMRDFGLTAYASFPLFAGEELIGTVAFGTRGPMRFSLSDVRLARTIADFVAVAIKAHQARTALEKSQADLRELINAVPHIVWISQSAGGISYFNAPFYEYTGLSSPIDTAMLWKTVVHPDDLPAALDTRNRAIASHLPWDVEYRLRRFDGAYRWHRGRAAFLREAGTNSNEGKWIGTATDIHEEVEARQALKLSNDMLEARVAERTEALAEAGARRQVLVRQLVSAQEKERGRIARELHDEMGQDMTALVLGLSRLKTDLPDLPAEKANAALVRLQAVAMQLAEKTHRTAFALRPTALDDLGLIVALQNYVDEWKVWSGIVAELEVLGEAMPRLPVETETTIYRVVQEALTNILRHAKGAKKASVVILRGAGEVRVSVEDDGPGFDAEFVLNTGRENPRLGLFGMQERAHLAGGTFSIESQRGQGTTVYLCLPLLA